MEIMEDNKKGDVMKAKELAEQLLKNPDFDIKFSFNEVEDFKVSNWGIDVREFNNIKIGDIGYSNKVIVLDGDEIK